MSVMQAECRHPERTVIGHPFNPPHVIPLVEVVGGTRTAPETIRDTMSFYTSFGKRPIHLKKAIPENVANLRFAVRALPRGRPPDQQGVLDVGDSDDAVSWGQGSGGGHGTQSAVASRWRRGWHPAFHGHIDAADGHLVVAGSVIPNSASSSGEDRQRRPGRG